MWYFLAKRIRFGRFSKRFSVATNLFCRKFITRGSVSPGRSEGLASRNNDANTTPARRLPLGSRGRSKDFWRNNIGTFCMVSSVGHTPFGFEPTTTSPNLHIRVVYASRPLSIMLFPREPSEASRMPENPPLFLPVDLSPISLVTPSLPSRAFFKTTLRACRHRSRPNAF